MRRRLRRRYWHRKCIRLFALSHVGKLEERNGGMKDGVDQWTGDKEEKEGES